MSNSFEHYIKTSSELVQKRECFVTITLTSVKGSAPQDLGARIIIGSTGILFGTVGGGKLEAFVIKEATDILINKVSKKSNVKVNLQKDIGMSCGGEVTLLFEPTMFDSGWPIVIFGAGHICQSLTRVLLKLNCSLTVIDQRIEWLDKLPASEKLRKVETPDLQSYISELDEDSYVCLMTMGHQTDLPVLEKALQRNFPYLGVIGSTTKRNALEKDLNNLGCSRDQIDSFICPIGEDFGSNDPEEIALSIAAQLLKRRDYLGKQSL